MKPETIVVLGSVLGVVLLLALIANRQRQVRRRRPTPEAREREQIDAVVQRLIGIKIPPQPGDAPAHLIRRDDTKGRPAVTFAHWGQNFRAAHLEYDHRFGVVVWCHSKFIRQQLEVAYLATGHRLRRVKFDFFGFYDK